MALTGTSRGQGTNNTSALTFTLSPASNFTAGAMAVICIAADNSDSAGGAHSTFTVTDTLGNTWTRRVSALIDPGAASAGHEGAIFTTLQNGGTLQTGTVITVTFDANSTAETWTLMEVSGSVGTPTFRTSGVGTGGTGTTSPTITTASINNGEMVIAALFLEAGTTQTITQDADTTNGSWSAQQTAEIGSTTSGSNIASQRKVVTATATQTYNPTLGILGDLCLGWIAIQEISTVSGSFTLDAFFLRVEERTATLNAVLFKTVTPSFTLDAIISKWIFVRQATNGNTGSQTTITVNITTPTAGNLLVTAIGSDKTAGTYTIPTGFAVINQDITADVSGAMAWKVADGTETSVIWSQTTASPAGLSAWVGEYLPPSGTIVVDASAETVNDGGSVQSRSSGTTAATVDAHELAVAMVAADTWGSVDLTQAWTNDFSQLAFVGSGAGPPACGVAFKLLFATGAVETTFSTTDTGDQMYAQVATFTVTAASIESSFTFNAVIKKTMQPYRGLVLATGPNGYWRLGESSGVVARDETGVNDGTYVNTPTLGVASLLTGDTNTAVDFDNAQTESAIVPDHSSLDLGDTLTLEAIVKPNSNGIVGTRGIISKGGTGYYMRLSSGRLNFAKSKNVDIALAVAGSALTDGQIAHVAATKNGSDVHLYVNGVDVTDTVNNATIDDNVLALHIGSDASVFDIPDEWFDGVIDEAAVYDTALTAAQIKEHVATFAGGLTGFTLDTIIKREQAASFTLDAIIRRTESASFTLDALIVEPIWVDTFTRSVLGSPDIGAIYELIDGTPALDGSELTKSPALLIIEGGRGALVGSVQFDFKWAGGSFTAFVRAGNIGVGLGITGSAFVFAIDQDTVSFEFSPENDVWWTVKSWVDEFNGNGQKVKVWRRQDPEPDWQAEGVGFDVGTAPGQLTWNSPAGAIDNILVRMAEGPAWTKAQFTLDAVILRTQSASFVLDAVLFRTTSASFSLDAITLRTESASFALDAAIATLFFEDDFERSVPQYEGLGGRWVYDFTTGTTDLVWVTGGAGVYDTDMNRSPNPARFTGAPIPESGVVQYDVWLEPADETGPELLFNEGGGEGRVDLFARGSTEWRLEVRSLAAGRFDFTVPVAAWYRVRANYGPTMVRAKVWKIGDAEPDWLVLGNVFDLFGNNFQYAALLLAGGIEGVLDDIEVDVKVDNFKLWKSGADVTAYTRSLFLLDAIIRRPVSSTPRTITTFDADISDTLESFNTVYATARAGSNVAQYSAAFVGQLFSSPTYFVDEAFFQWDTSSIGVSTILAARIAYQPSSGVGIDFISEWRVHPGWGFLEVADFVAGDDLASFTLVATRDTTDHVGGEVYEVVDVDLVDNINPTGDTQFFVSSEAQRLNQAPAGFSAFEYQGTYHGGAALTVEYATAFPLSPTLDALLRQTQTATFSLDATIATLFTQDTFTRTVALNATNWGVNDDGSIRWVVRPQSQLPDPGDEMLSVDGSVAKITPLFNFNFGFTGYPSIRWGIFQFDWRFRTDTNFGELASFQVTHGQANPLQADVLSIQRDDTGTLVVFNYFGDSAQVTGLVDGDWVRVQGHYHEIDETPTVIKIWKVGDAEPRGTNTVSDFGQAVTHPGLVGIISVDADHLTAIEVDNFKWWTSDGAVWSKFLTFDAIKRREVSASFSLNATIMPTFTLDAITRREQSASFTLEAFIAGEGVAAFAFNAIVRREQTASFTLDAAIATLVWNDTFTRTVPLGLGTNDGKAYAFLGGSAERVEVDGSEARIHQHPDGTYANYSVPPGVFHGTLQFDFLVPSDTDEAATDYWLLRDFYYQFLVLNSTDVGEWRAYSPATSSDLFIQFGVEPSTWYTIKLNFNIEVTTNGYLKVWKRGDPEPDWMVTAVLDYPTVDAPNPFLSWFFQAPFIAPFTEDSALDNFKIWSSEPVGHWNLGFALDAIVKSEQSASFALDAILRREQSVTFTLDAIALRTYTFGATLDAILLRADTRTFALDAVLLRTATATFTLDAVILRTQSATFTLDAVIKTTVTQGAALDAVLFKTSSATFTLDAVLMPSFTLDAIVRREQTATFTLDAWIPGNTTFGVTFDAVLRTQVSASFTLDSFFLRTETRTFSTDAIAKRTATATLALDSVIRRTESASFVLDAVQLKTTAAGATVDAVLFATRTAGSTLDAVLLSPAQAQFSLDAIQREIFTAGFGLDAQVGLHFKLDAFLAQPPPTVFTPISATLAADFISGRPVADTISGQVTADTIEAELEIS